MSSYKINFAKQAASFDGAYSLIRTQILSADIDEVFRFFCDPNNLEYLTPPWLGFRIIQAPKQIYEGALIDYQLRLHGLRVYWKTRIELWQSPQQFVDRQIRGPYQLWHHTHQFETVQEGVLMRDIVRYKIPFQLFAPLTRRLFVAPELERIFDYRASAIKNVFTE